MKSRLCSLLLLSFLTISFYSCKKDTDKPYPTTIEGLWIGTYTVNELTQDPQFYSFSIKPGGDILVEGKGGDDVTYYSAGTWKLSNDTLKAEIHSINVNVKVTQSLTAIFDPMNRKLKNGVWKDIAGASLSGTFQMDKVK
ncbi:hypothetical protein QTN47_01245 [Danxiaibacter flavus]|uniref:Lipocalin-like domain-containing protein n=1 Tax=Danxiaibacter flavus TaxID=3049108 RepID=A0ABV3Z8B1_9BACT|nr:hypothetical protein QNM32_01245 [Chitinophagaceae bacterium DXS]